MTQEQTLQGKRVAIIVTDYGIEQAELEKPRQAALDAGADVTLLSTAGTTVQTLVDDKDPGKTFEADGTLEGTDASGFDALIIPGGTINADTLRQDDGAVAFATAFIEAGKPIAAICHAPWTLIETGRLRGKTLTSFWSLETDVKNAGGTWVDSSVQVDDSDGWTLVTSRNPDDMDDFTRELVRVFAS